MEEGFGMKKRLISILLLAVLLLTLLPAVSLAEEPGDGGEAPPAEPDPIPGTEEPAEPDPVPGTEEPAEPGTPDAPGTTVEPGPAAQPAGGQAEADADAADDADASETGKEPGNVWGIPADDVIWYGFYDEAPVAWLVLDDGQTNMGTEGVYLLSRDLIDIHKVVFDEDSTLWEGSLAQEWCTNFAESAFTPDESALVPLTSKHDEQARLYLLDWREMDLKEEQVFFLSAIELDQYFGSYGGDTKTTIKRCSMEDYYWLRSPILYHDDYHGMVLHSNTGHDYMPNHHWSARPCMNLSLQDAVWLLPAADEGQPGAVSVPERTDGEAQEWKLIVPREEHAFRLESSTLEDGKLSLGYSGAETGETAMLSLLARDEDGAPLGLWRMEHPAAARGELEVDLKILNVPEDADLFLFCEELNEACRSNYASPLQRISLQESEAEPETTGPQEPVVTPGDEESTGTIAPVSPAPQRKADKGRTMGTVGKIITAVILGLLALGLLANALRRQSIIPLILLILLLLLAAVVDLRAGFGFFPGL